MKFQFHTHQSWLHLYQKIKKQGLDYAKKYPTKTFALVFLVLLLGAGNLYITIIKHSKPLNISQTTNNWKRLSDTTHIKEHFTNKVVMPPVAFINSTSQNPSSFDLLPSDASCSASINKTVTVTFHWTPSSGAQWYLALWSTSNFDPTTFSPTSIPATIEHVWVNNDTHLTQSGFTPGRTIYFTVIARVNQNDADGTVAAIGTNSIQTLLKCDGTDPVNSQYTLTTQFDKDSYNVGDTAKFCYHINPEGVPFHVKITQTLPTTVSKLDTDDNGVGGGDCVTGAILDSDKPQMKFHTEITIGGQIVANNDATASVSSSSTTGTPNTTGTPTNTPAPTGTTTPGAATATPTSAPGTTVTPTQTPTTTPTLAPCTTPGATATPTTSSGATATPTSAQLNSPLDQEEWNYVTILNVRRVSLGVGKLKVSTKLTNSAKWKSNDMATTGILNHVDSLGRNIGQRFSTFGYSGSASENIGSVGPTGQNIYDAYLNGCDDYGSGCTYEHKLNQEKGQWQVIGVSRHVSTNGQNYWWAQDFGATPDTEITPPAGITAQNADSAPCATPTPNPNATTLSLAISLPGIGLSTGSNTNPNDTTRTIHLSFESSTVDPKNLTETLNFNSSSGNFEGNFDISNLTPATYSVKGKIDNTLSKILNANFEIVGGKHLFQISPQTLLPGDITNDDALSIQDYTSFLACYKGLSTCDNDTKKLSDLNDDGKIDIDDLNILQRSFKQSQ